MSGVSSGAALVSLPGRVLRKARRFIDRAVGGGRYVAAEPYRSESERGTYVAAVERALASDKAFARFKQDPDYRAILEHVTPEQANGYFSLLQRDAPNLLERIDEFRRNDWIGSPVLMDFPKIERFSPTTMRYLKVASDLRVLFGDLDDAEIAEVGGGYGGQLLVADLVLAFKRWTIYDLPPVLRLISRYLEAHLLRGAYAVRTLNQDVGSTVYDLVISNYAFSELPANVQMNYLRKVLSTAKRGYLTMNSGMGMSEFDRNKLSLDELRESLPPIEIFEEKPLSFKGNYIIAWGHSGSLT